MAAVMSPSDFDPTQIRLVRKKLDLTQAQFAKQAGVSQSFIAKLEAGRIDPTYSKVKAIAQAVDQLLHREETKAGDLMTSDILSARPQDNVQDLIGVISRRGISQLPVMDGPRLLGLITESGLLEAQASRPLSGLKARDVMTDAPPIVSPSTPSSAVMGLLRFFPCVLVCKDSRVLGIITKADFLKAMLH